ncbi:MAG: cytochrome C oxidase subunit IV family protein [Aigarchaeota archaeon]|nr:cytochrome C oxidase subunit IV family protein [Aigarchaeota archaeon]MDW8093277.1 cytochrome C oxidase subunit IV family protein [Nitrososphaerota archaeon]
MANVLIYAIVYFVLMVVTAVEILVIGFPIPHDVVVASLLGLAALKAVMIAMYFQHLRYEPRPLSGPAILGLVAVFLFLGLSLWSIIGIR